MAESKGWAQALRRVTRGGADSTSSPGSGFSNMRDCAATMRKNLTQRTQRTQRRCEKSNRDIGEFCSRWRPACCAYGKRKRQRRDAERTEVRRKKEDRQKCLSRIVIFLRRRILRRRRRISFGTARHGPRCPLVFACR